MNKFTYCGSAADTAQPILRKAPILLLFLFFTLLPASAVKRIDANPINVAYMLAQDTDTASMKKTCEFYGYTLQSSQDGYTVFSDKNGSTIRYSFKDEAYPYVEVKSKSGNPDAILTNLGFQKQGSIYQKKENKFTRSKFNCAPGAGSTLIFHKTLIPQSSSK